MSAARSWIRRVAALALLASLLAGIGGQAIGAEPRYPVKPVRLIIPYAPGGGVDAAGRVLAPHLGGILGQQVVVENRAGGATVIGIMAVVNSPADGYNLLLISTAIVTNQALIKNLPYDAVRDLRAVSHVSSSPLVLVVNAKLPITDVKSLIAYARANPGKMNYGTAGMGTSTHLSAELFRATSGLDITGIFYKGSGPATTDLVSGQVQMAFSSLAAIQPYIASGDLRALATTGLKRNASLPNLPAVAESIPGFEADLWMALYAPAKTPDDVIRRVNGAVRTALKSDQLREAFLKVGQEATGSTPEEAQAFTHAEMVKWTKLIRDAKIEVPNN
jgi:tripartite-type tricarboxylate transporter receptor subunit TctC